MPNNILDDLLGDGSSTQILIDQKGQIGTSKGLSSSSSSSSSYAQDASIFFDISAVDGTYFCFAFALLLNT